MDCTNTAAAALKWHSPEKTYLNVSSVDSEWRLSGRNEPQTEQDREVLP